MGTIVNVVTPLVFTPKGKEKSWSIWIERATATRTSANELVLRANTTRAGTFLNSLSRPTPFDAPVIIIKPRTEGEVDADFEVPAFIQVTIPKCGVATAHVRGRLGLICPNRTKGLIKLERPRMAALYGQDARLHRIFSAGPAVVRAGMFECHQELDGDPITDWRLAQILMRAPSRLSPSLDGAAVLSAGSANEVKDVLAITPGSKPPLNIEELPTEEDSVFTGMDVVMCQ